VTWWSKWRDLWLMYKIYLKLEYTLEKNKWIFINYPLLCFLCFLTFGWLISLLMLFGHFFPPGTCWRWFKGRDYIHPFSAIPKLEAINLRLYLANVFFLVTQDNSYKSRSYVWVMRIPCIWRGEDVTLVLCRKRETVILMAVSILSLLNFGWNLVVWPIDNHTDLHLYIVKFWQIFLLREFFKFDVL
jgi:hypothetical protein